MTNFTFTKKESLISRPENMPEPGPYYTTIVNMKDVKSFPYDYALYFSTDHHREEGGIWLYVCNGLPTEAANWQSYDQAVTNGGFDHLTQKPAANPIFTDPVQGNGHTETPHANVIDNTVYMTYHKNGINKSQATLLATSKDGVNFERINGEEDSVVLSYDRETDVGDGHTGYFRWAPNPFPGIVQKYVGYSLHGGGDDYHSAIWTSDNAIKWKRLAIFTPVEGYTVEEDRMLIWHEFDPHSVTKLDNGEYVALCAGGNRASGGVERVSELYEIYLSEDGRTLTRQSQKLLSVGSTEDDDVEELASPTTIVINGTYHLIYVGAKAGGQENTVMGAVGKLDTKEPQSPPLDPSNQQHHIYRGSSQANTDT
jgi:hypothetical protein